MRIAVISDVHANLEAFREVCADLDARDPDDVLCLGDTIGYGPEPEACVRLLKGRAIPSVAGNHERGVADSRRLTWFNPHSRESLLLTRDMLSEASLRWAASLPDHLVRHEARFVHGCPPRAVNLYLFQVPDHALPTVFSRYPEQVCFVGHTHELELVSLARNTARRLRLEEGTTALDPRARHIVNAGSVGQPRDGDSHAKYLIWDTRAMEIEVRFVEYDVASTVTSIRNKGLPERDAARLAALDRRRRGGDG